MKNLKRIALVLLALCMLVALCACAAKEAPAAPAEGDSAPADADAPVIGVSLSSTTNNPYLMAMSQAVVAALEAKGYVVDLQDADMDATKQSTQFNNLITKGVDLIVYWQFDAAAAVSDAQKAQQAGIPVINFFVNASEEAEQFMNAYVGASQFDIGFELGKIAAEKMGDEGNYVIVNGMEGASDFVLRADGFRAGLAEGAGTYTELAEEYSHSDRTQAQTIMENFLTAYPDIDLVFCGNDDFGIGVYNAIKAAGRGDEMALLGIDGSEQCLQLIEQGEWDVTVYQTVEMMGEKVAEVTEKVLAGEEIDYDQTLPILVVDESNVAEYISK